MAIIREQLDDKKRSPINPDGPRAAIEIDALKSALGKARNVIDVVARYLESLEDSLKANDIDMCLDEIAAPSAIADECRSTLAAIDESQSIKCGDVIILDPDHAPDAVEAAVKVLYPHDEAAWLAAYNTAGKLRLTNRATAAIAAYIEAARK